MLWVPPSLSSHKTLGTLLGPPGAPGGVHQEAHQESSPRVHDKITKCVNIKIKCIAMYFFFKFILNVFLIFYMKSE